MGIWDFVKAAGEKIFGIGDADAGEPKADDLKAAVQKPRHSC